MKKTVFVVGSWLLKLIIAKNKILNKLKTLKSTNEYHHVKNFYNLYIRHVDIYESKNPNPPPPPLNKRFNNNK